MNVGVEVLVWVVAIAGIYILVDGVIEPPMHMFHWILIVAGIIMFVIGLIPILNGFEVISFQIPFLNNKIVYWTIITLEGLGLSIAGVTMH